MFHSPIATVSQLVITSCDSFCCVLIGHRSAKRVGEKKIYLITDAGSEYSDDKLDQICAGLKHNNIELVVV